jgi:hypothetical protein
MIHLCYGLKKLLVGMQGNIMYPKGWTQNLKNKIQ